MNSIPKNLLFLSYKFSSMKNRKNKFTTELTFCTLRHNAIISGKGAASRGCSQQL